MLYYIYLHINIDRLIHIDTTIIATVCTTRYVYTALIQVSRAYSKNWAHRGNALVKLQEKIENHPDSPKEDTRDLWRASFKILERTLKDNVFQV